MIEKVKVTGVKFFKDTIDGKQIDSGSIFVEEYLDDSRGNAKGFATIKYALTNSDDVKAIMHNTFPLTCEVEFKRMTNGNTSKISVGSIKPVAPSPQTKQ